MVAKYCLVPSAIGTALSYGSTSLHVHTRPSGENPAGESEHFNVTWYSQLNNMDNNLYFKYVAWITVEEIFFLARQQVVSTLGEIDNASHRLARHQVTLRVHFPTTNPTLYTRSNIYIYIYIANAIVFAVLTVPWYSVGRVRSHRITVRNDVEATLVDEKVRVSADRRLWKSVEVVWGFAWLFEKK